MLHFFSAQLVSAQRLSALFSLRAVCPVANLNFKCLAGHVFLEFLFDKNRCYESVLLFNFILEALWKILFSQKPFYRFSKKYP